ncbi:metal ABC transporter permease [Natronospira bacteriovora]|uniref:Metal ABC transporter permease n=1 Tax=Natronospira bacteriovora TaxID=3069753 RepID=A0ABU0W7E8_9GAMM|nr:metal ABC transporter permease [Natronospira sp. AB-CW4]MDQ2069948.1 metal ABC transporter permease [Natronospira sp. AB-CW4]
MSDFILFDPMFRLPFLIGLLLAVGLSLIGAYLRMREEWLAALGLSHMAAAGGIAALPLGIPALAGALGFAGLAALLKGLLPKASNNHYGLMLLLGWGGALMLAANTHQGEVVGEALLRGQLYFTSKPHLIAASLLILALFSSLSWLSPRLLTERFFPDYFSANRIPAWPHRLVFGALVVVAAVLGTLAMGAMAAFAMFFVPAWVAFVLARGWRRALMLTIVLAVASYLTAFVASMLLDQPFGPTLVLCLALTATLRLFANRAARLSGAPGE